MTKPAFITTDGTLRALTVNIASHFGLPHYNVLRKARRLHGLNPAGFVETTYKGVSGRVEAALEVPEWALAGILTAITFQQPRKKAFLKAMFEAKERMSAKQTQLPAVVPAIEVPATVPATVSMPVTAIDRLSSVLDRLVRLQEAEKMEHPGPHFTTTEIAKVHGVHRCYAGRLIKHLKTPQNGEELKIKLPNGTEKPQWIWNENGREAVEQVLARRNGFLLSNS